MIVKDRLIGFVHEVFRLSHVPSSINKTFMVLIPKALHPVSFNQYRLISLCNFVYKVIAKLITTRLRRLKNISPPTNEHL